LAAGRQRPLPLRPGEREAQVALLQLVIFTVILAVILAAILAVILAVILAAVQFTAQLPNEGVKFPNRFASGST
jgi:hypothetical protein